MTGSADATASSIELGRNALDGNGPDLLSLRFGVPPQPGDPGRQEHLKRVDPLGAGGDRHDRDHAGAEPSRSAVSGVVVTTRAGRVSLAPDPQAGSRSIVTCPVPVRHGPLLSGSQRSPFHVLT
jgi:hypothetical protein